MQADGALTQTVSGPHGRRAVLPALLRERADGGHGALAGSIARRRHLVPAHSVPPVGGGSYREVFSDVFAASAAELALSFVKGLRRAATARP